MRETSNITKKGAAVALAAVTAMSLSVPATALAAEGEEQVDTGSGTTTTTTTTTSNDVTGVLTGTTSGSTAVTTAYTSEYTVTLPESVAMGDSHSATQTASVTVKGKIAAGKQVNVVPAKSITMKSTAGNETYDLTVEAGTTAWSQSDVTTAGTAKDNATISAGDAWLPGTFSGSLTYTISLGDAEAAAADAEAQTFTYQAVYNGELGSSATLTVDPTADKDATIASLTPGLKVSVGEYTGALVNRNGYVALVNLNADGTVETETDAEGNVTEDKGLLFYTDSSLTTPLASTATVKEITGTLYVHAEG